MTEEDNYSDEGIYEEEEEDCTVANADVIQKYKLASKFSNKALDAIKQSAIEGASIYELCCMGDRIITDECSKVYTKKGDSRVDKGLAFPTCVSVNEAVCHISPDADEAKSFKPLKANDVVRIDLGCHIDGYCGLVADTVIIGGAEHSSRSQNIINATKAAMNVVVRALRPGVKYYEITDLIERVAKEYKVNVVDGALSHRISRYIIDGGHIIATKDSPDGKVRDLEVGENEVWAIDIFYTSGQGKLKQKEQKPLVFKRSLENKYQLKLQAARDVLKTINQKFQTFPFSIRYLDQKRGRIGLQECLRNDMVVAYPVLYEKEGEVVAQLKSTVIVTSQKIDPITGAHALSHSDETTFTDEKILEWKMKSLQLQEKN